MRIFRGCVLLISVVVLILFCLDNRGLVNIKLGFNTLLSQDGVSIELPLFFIVLFSVAIGFLLGSISEFFRGNKLRNDHRTSVRNLSEISSELEEMKKQKKSQKEELLSLLK